MKTLITIIFLSLLSSSCSVPSDDLVVRDGVYYKKFSDVPFSGKVTGSYKGLIKNGKKEGAWVSYYADGQLHYKGNYKNGKMEGRFIYNSPNEEFNKKWSGIFRNGVKISD